MSSFGRSTITTNPVTDKLRFTGAADLNDQKVTGQLY